MTAAGSEAPTETDGHRDDVRLLTGSALFDPAWYARVTGVDGSPDELAADYLERPTPERPSPHPLFLRDHVAAELRERLEEDVADRDPLLVYLRRGLRFPTHPLFDVEHYAAATPGARRHPGGAFGHYLAADPADRAPGADWLPDAEPGLLEWVVAHHDAWRARHRDGEPQAVRRRWLTTAGPRPPASRDDEVVVVVEAGHSLPRLRESLESIVAQSHRRWRVLVADPGLAGCEQLLEEVMSSSRWDRTEVVPAERRWFLAPVLETLLPPPAGGSGDPSWVAFLRSGETWEPGRLGHLLEHAAAHGADAVCDVLEELRAEAPPLLLGRGMPAGSTRNPEWTELSRLLVSRRLLAEVGVPDPALGRGWEFDLVTRLARPAGVTALRSIGVRRHAGVLRTTHRLPVEVRPRVVAHDVPTAAHEVLGERLIDWADLARTPRRRGLTSVVVVTYRDWRMTEVAVRAVLSAADADVVHGEVEVVVVDNGCGPAAAAVLASLPERDPRVRVVHEPVNHGFGVGSNLGLAASQGDTVVFLNNDTTVSPGWLGPLRAALTDPEVLGAQPLLLYPTGTIQCAGVVLPRVGGMPYPLLQGFPTLDAQHVAEVHLPAITGAALALRADDVIDLHGFDPVFLNGMEDIDLCLRLARRRPGHFVCRPDSTVLHHESRTPGRYRHLASNRRLYLERWGRHGGDDVAAWRSVGYDLLGHDTPPEGDLPRETWVSEPLLRRRRRVEVDEAPPRLRWAIKNPAPALPVGDRWGDTHFADALASGLRSLGQDVIIDRRQEHARRTGRHDDVELVLRGLAPYRPVRQSLSLCWVISHPDMLPLAEAALYDRVLAASEPWSQRQAAAWGIRIDPLLQATDPVLFHPDRAVPDTGHPVLFVGSSRNTVRPVVAAAVEHGLPLSVYGREWDGLVDRHYVKGEYLPNDQLGAAYRSAGVVLNDHWEDMRTQGFVSNRLFDAAAAGARVVTDDVAGLPEVFGRSVQVIGDPEDLVRLTSLTDPDTVFGSDGERREVAARLAEDHSFTARAARLLEVALEIRRERGPEC